MKLHNLIEKLRAPFDITDFGVFSKKMSSKVYVYKSSIEGVEKIVVFYKGEGVLDKINFVSDKPILSVNDLKAELGEFKTGYSFRDDITKLSFEKTFGSVKSITTKRDNKLEITEDKVTQTTPQGIKSEFELSEKVFSSICFVF